jgi:hypothetical protein
MIRPEGLPSDIEIRSLEDVRPGDLMFTGMGRAPSKAIAYGGQLVLGEHVRLGPLVIGHVAIVVEASRNLPPGTMRNRKTGEYLPGGISAGMVYDRNGFDEYPTGVITAPRIVEAMSSGARERALRSSDWSPRTAFVRLPEDWPGQAADAAAIARLTIGTPYGFGSYAQLAAWRFGWKTPALERHINRRRPEPIRLANWSNGPDVPSNVTRGGHLPVELICSQQADECWTAAGKQVMPHGTKPQIVTPGALALHLNRAPGVVWAGPGIL